MAHRFQIEPGKLLEVLKATVIKSTDKHEVTNEEVAAFVIVANQYGLNPFTREIHAFAGRTGGIVPIVGVDGWAHIVNADARFDGCSFEDIEDKKYGAGIKCIMHVKGRSHPIEVTEWLIECQRPTEPWKTMHRRMLRHKAFMQAARLCFGLAGIYDEDEARDIIKVQATEPAEDNGATKTRTDALADKIEKQLRTKSPTQEPPPEPVAHDNDASGQAVPDEPQAETLPPAHAVDPRWRESLIQEIEKQIEQADNENALGDASKLMLANREELGEEAYKAIETFYQKKFRELSKGKKAKGGK